MVDPIAVLPSEILRQIWDQLDEKDLLCCRAVSSGWGCHLDSSPTWKRFINEDRKPVKGTSAWCTYFQIRCHEACWARGIMDKYQHGVLPCDKICVAENLIYIARGKELLIFDNSLRGIKIIEMDQNINKLYSWGQIVGVVTQNERYKYNVVLFDDMARIDEFAASSNVLGMGYGKVCFIKDQKLCVLRNGRITEELELPGEVSRICVMKSAYAILTIHPVNRGCGYTVYWRSEQSDKWDFEFECVNRCPLFVKFGDIHSNEKDLVIVQGVQWERTYSYNVLSVVETHLGSRETLQKGLATFTNPYFRSSMSNKYFAFVGGERLLRLINLEDDTVKNVEIPTYIIDIHLRGDDQVIILKREILYYKSTIRRYSIFVDFDIVGSSIQKDSIIVWGWNTIQSFVVLWN